VSNEPTVREDLGYRTGMAAPTIRRSGEPEKIKIEYTQGLMVGQVVWVKTLIADALIRRGFAREIQERQPGEEG
jgi:hypothetical protein